MCVEPLVCIRILYRGELLIPCLADPGAWRGRRGSGERQLGTCVCGYWSFSHLGAQISLTWLKRAANRLVCGHERLFFSCESFCRISLQPLVCRERVQNSVPAKK